MQKWNRRGRRGMLRAAAAATTVAAVAAGAALAPSTGAGTSDGVFTVSPTAVAGVRVGTSFADARRRFGTPTRSFERAGWTSFAWIRGERIVYVRGRARVEAIELTGPTFRTARGDRYGASAASVRRTWPSGRSRPSCCSTARHWTVPTANGVFVLTVAGGKLSGVTLATRAYFDRCYRQECD